MILKRAIVFVAFLYSSLAFSAAGDYFGKIEAILAGPGHSGMVYIEVAGEVTGGCATHQEYSFSLDTSDADKKGSLSLSMLLAAYVAGKDVWLSGTNTCVGTVEGLHQFKLGKLPVK